MMNVATSSPSATAAGTNVRLRLSRYAGTTAASRTISWTDVCGTLRGYDDKANTDHATRPAAYMLLRRTSKAVPPRMTPKAAIRPGHPYSIPVPRNSLKGYSGQPATRTITSGTSSRCALKYSSWVFPYVARAVPCPVPHGLAAMALSSMCHI